jgi:hypothetical protein
MIQRRDIQVAWMVFRHGHFDWWWTDDRGVISCDSYPSEIAARTAMEEHQWLIRTKAKQTPPAETNSEPLPASPEVATPMLALPI